MIRKTLPLVFLLAVVGHQAEPAKPEEESVHKFVEDFYRWYVPIAVKYPKEEAADWTAIKQRPFYFSAQLLKGLQEDAAAQVKAGADLVGLDYDPFLNSQDPTEHFKIGQVTRKNDGYWVEVYTPIKSAEPEKDEKPRVIAVVTKSGDHWVFSNFRFTEDGDLLKNLELLKKERQEFSH